MQALDGPPRRPELPGPIIVVGRNVQVEIQIEVGRDGPGIEPVEFLEVGCQILIRDDAAAGVGERRCRRILRILGEILHG